MAEALTRRYDLDALRVLAVLVLLAYHSSRPFDSEAWHVKSAQLSRMLELLGYVFTPWRLSLLFLISGAGTFFALRTRTARVYLGDRMQRLLLPLAVGMLVAVQPQVYVERANPWMPNRQSPMNFDGSFLAFLPHVFDGAYPKGNFSWHHLWLRPISFDQRARRRLVEPGALLHPVPAGLRARARCARERRLRAPPPSRAWRRHRRDDPAPGADRRRGAGDAVLPALRRRLYAARPHRMARARRRARLRAAVPRSPVGLAPMGGRPRAAIAGAALIAPVVVCELVGRTNLTRAAFGMRPRHGSGR